MESFRNPKYVERYEDVVFDLDTPLKTTVANNAHQVKTGFRIIADNSGEVTPFDWYNTRLMVNFKVNKLAGGNLIADDNNGIVNGSYSLINEIVVKGNGIQLYNCQPCNHAVNVKSLLEYDRDYAETTATNHLFYLDLNASAEGKAAETLLNKGFAIRKALLGTSSLVNTEILLNRYSFFESLEDELLPNMKVELNFTIESDDNLIWRGAGGAVCRVIITKMQLFVPRITFNSAGQSQYLSKYLRPHKWTYLREMIEIGPSVTQQTGSFRITSGINRPRHVFIWMIADDDQDDQEKNPFLYNTFHLPGNENITSCHLEVGNDNLYPENEYQVSTEMSRVFRDVLKYSHSINYYRGGTLLTRSNYENLFSIIYFDLRNQKQDIKDGTTKLTFKYKLSGATDTHYKVYALVLYEQDMEMFQSSGKLMLRS